MVFRKAFASFVMLCVVVALVMPAASAFASNENADSPSRIMQVEGQTIRVGTNAEYPPFESVDEEGNIVGFDVDLLTALAEDAGFEIEWVNTRWDGIFVALSEGEFDAVISAATITEEREEIIDFTNPYFNAGQVISVSADNAETLTTPEDLAGLRIGVQLGTTGDEYATQIEGAVVERYDEVTLAFQALGDGEVDAVIADSPTSADIIANNPDLNLMIVGEPLTEEYYGIAVNSERADLLEALNASLEVVIADGTYAEIYEAYFGAPPPSEFLPEGMMVELDPTDPTSVILYVLNSTFTGDYDGLVSVVCEEALDDEDAPTPEEIAEGAEGLEGFTIDYSGLTFEVEISEAGDEAFVTIDGDIIFSAGDVAEAVPFAEIDDDGEPTRLVLIEEAWFLCPAEEE
jgi:polar amino acid transport system substrate-binding protein